MVKKLYIVGAVLFASVACNKIEQPIEKPMDSPKEWTVSIQATKGDDLTKALSESGTTISACWEIGDVVYIVSANGNKEFGTMTAQSGGTSTTLTGTITKTMTVGTSYILRYLQKGQDYLYLVSQQGTLSDIAKNHDMAEATVTVKSIDGNNVTFEETIAHFESKISITKFTFDKTVSWVGIYSSNLMTYVRPGYSYNYSCISIEPKTNFQTAYVAMSTLANKKSVFMFLAKGEDGLYYMAAKNVQLENGKNYITNVTLHEMPAYVDLGIVRGGHHVCWATKNLGASSPGQFGNYYAWAETTSKSTYSWDNYAYGSYSWVTKYNDRSDQGTVDGKLYLDPEDDAATASLGSGWRMPSIEDFNDLLNSSNTEVMYVFADQRWGYLFHSIIEGYTGKFFFLPRTNGYYKDDAITNNGSNRGYYWSNNVEHTSWTSASFANTLQFTGTSAPETSMMQRAYGLVIRPIYEQ
ncbi:MAG: hypothetical protein K6E37_00680 [Bacteroidales bacterium]|nr:hypothetical protein [Bacteroidales bacterium]